MDGIMRDKLTSEGDNLKSLNAHTGLSFETNKMNSLASDRIDSKPRSV